VLANLGGDADLGRFLSFTEVSDTDAVTFHDTNPSASADDPLEGSIVIVGGKMQVGVISNTQHGNRGGGALHAAATGLVSGFLSSADKTRLDGMANGATNTPLSSATPAAVGSAAAGSGTSASKDDHVHAHGNQLGGSLHSAAVASTSDGFITGADQARLDGMASGATNTPLSSATPTDLGSAGPGSGTSASKDDHIHGHGNLGGGSLHSDATSGTSGFMPGGDKTLFDLNNSSAQSLPTPGAVDVVHRTTRLTTSGVGADAATLANGAAVGQRKSIILTTIAVGGDSVVLTPTSFADGVTLTFSVLHDGAELEWNGAAWGLVSKSGAVIA
jgi:hypothetical protein